jgi:hypothetical protein
MTTKIFFALLALGIATPAFAVDKNKEGFYETGEGIRFKKVAFINVKVYDITSYAKELPASTDKAAMISLDADKKLAWRMLRSVDSEKIRNALREGFAKNGYTDKAKIDQFIAPFQNELKDGSYVTIAYDAASKKTTVFVSGGKAVVEGADFMKATWSLWFGNIDQPDLSQKLIDNLKK